MRFFLALALCVFALSAFADDTQMCPLGNTLSMSRSSVVTGCRLRNRSTIIGKADPDSGTSECLRQCLPEHPVYKYPFTNPTEALTK